MKTWLAPSLPLGLFQALADRVSARLDRPVTLASETRWSGPQPWIDDPFARGEVDVGFLCAPSWTWLASRPEPSVVAVRAMPVPLDPRSAGRPVYFSDVIVPAAGARTLDALAGRTWAYNDPCSLSGWFALEARVGDIDAFFGRVVQSGSHLRSIAMVAAGEVDGAAIDSTVLHWVLAADPALRARIRVVASLGPHPIQPVVARAGLGERTIAAIGAALRTFRPGDGALAAYGMAGFRDGEPEPLAPELLQAVG